jgi:hypothetical protein
LYVRFIAGIIQKKWRTLDLPWPGPRVVCICDFETEAESKVLSVSKSHIQTAGRPGHGRYNVLYYFRYVDDILLIYDTEKLIYTLSSTASTTPLTT